MHSKSYLVNKMATKRKSLTSFKMEKTNLNSDKWFSLTLIRIGKDCQTESEIH